MDTSNEVSATDTLGRSVPPRRYRTREEKRRIVEETLARGASVAVVARKHEVNANLVFGWRKLYQKGLLAAEPTIPATPLLPVKITERAGRRTVPEAPRKTARRVRTRPEASTTAIEIELAQGSRVRVHGDAAAELLRQLIDALCHR